MEVISAPTIPDVKIVRPKVFADDRGYFFESYNQQVFEKSIGPISFCQDNESRSVRGVLRGLHYQLNPKAQTKLLRVVSGAIWDVAVDVRKSSPTFGKWFGHTISADNRDLIFVPAGFAHGFVVLSDTAVVQYKVDQYYSKEHERGIRYDDPTVGILWPMNQNLILSDKDKEQPLLQDAEVFA